MATPSSILAGRILWTEEPDRLWSQFSSVQSSRSVVSDSLHLHGLLPPGSSVHGDSPGKNTGVGFHALVQGIFPTEEWNSGLLHCRWILYHLSHKESPRILEWGAYPFSRN